MTFELNVDSGFGWHLNSEKQGNSARNLYADGWRKKLGQQYKITVYVYVKMILHPREKQLITEQRNNLYSHRQQCHSDYSHNTLRFPSGPFRSSHQQCKSLRDYLCEKCKGH